MILDERKECILKSIIDEYVSSAEPVSSGNLINKYPLRISSATVRNEMLELEKMGFLEKPYSSSGRIPSDIGYRYYVDNLIKKDKLSVKEMKLIKNNLEKKVATLEDMARMHAATISEVTHYTSIAITPKEIEDVISSVQFIRISTDTIMVLIITQKGIVKEAIIKFDEEISDIAIKDITNIFTKKLIGKPFGIISGKIEEFLKDEIGIGIHIITKIVEEINKAIIKNMVYINGPTENFRLPELSDNEMKNEYIEIMNNTGLLEEIIGNIENEGITIKIAGEDERLKNFSVITLTPNIENKSIGRITVLAPKRMDYRKVILTMEELLKKLEEGG